LQEYLKIIIKIVTSSTYKFLIIFVCEDGLHDIGKQNPCVSEDRNFTNANEIKSGGEHNKVDHKVQHVFS